MYGMYGYGYGYGLDPTIILVLIGVALSLWAQGRVNSTFSRYSRVRSMTGMTGAEAARRLLNAQGIYDVTVQQIAGELTDHYDPSANVIRLSDSVYNNDSVAAVGVAAHEAGHAVQYAEGYGPIKVRSAIIPITQFGSNLSTPLVILGIIFSSNVLITAGILLFCTVVLFQAITLPVEFNASGRALKVLREEHFLDDDEMKGAKSVLTAAALTYVAAMFSALASLARLLLIRNRNNSRR